MEYKEYLSGNEITYDCEKRTITINESSENPIVLSKEDSTKVLKFCVHIHKELYGGA